MKWCHNVGDIPKEPHYAILSQRSTYIPGDERSRTHPGHGYPATTEYSWDYIVFDDKDEWETEVKKRMASEFNRKDWIAISAMPAVVRTTFNVEI